MTVVAVGTVVVVVTVVAVMTVVGFVLDTNPQDLPPPLLKLYKTSFAQNLGIIFSKLI